MSETTHPGPLHGLRVIELADEKAQFCGKLMADLGADVILVEPPGGSSLRDVGPFVDDVPHRERSLSFWHYNTSKRAISLALEHREGRALYRQLVEGADIVLESTPPGYLASVELDYPSFASANPGLIHCALTPFGQSGPWAEYASSDLLHMAAGGEMASCGYDAGDVPADQPPGIPIAPGGGNAWHMGGHYAYIAIVAALVHRTVSGQGQYLDVAIHDACALTTEAAVPGWIYRGEVWGRQTGRHHAAHPTARTQFRARDGRYVCALVANQLGPRYVKNLAGLLDEFGFAHELHDPKYEDADTVQARADYLIEEVVGGFIASHDAETVYHAAQARGFTWGAVRPAEALLDDPHLGDRGYWKSVRHDEIDRTVTYPGEAAIYSATPWRITRRAPLIGEHNREVYTEELALGNEQLLVLAEQRAI